ncbi:MAG: transposase [Bryobacteraceae bacterium]|nr:transposase [Planctomycetota bacterium]NUN04051.1 transposase [Bryobacteraceae bacterium]
MKRTYTAEFRASAVALVLEEKYSFKDAASRLGINVQTLRYWVKLHRKKEGVKAPQQEQDLRKRIVELERENRRLTMERDILKKATAYFAKEQP